MKKMHFVLRHTMSQCLQSENLVSETTGNRFFLLNQLYTELHFRTWRSFTLLW